MAKKIFENENPLCDIKNESKETIDRISESMEAIETYFHDMEITAQQFDKDNMLQSECVIGISKNSLETITVNLDCANDEFYLGLKTPVLRQMFDKEPKYEDNILIEVVTEEVAKSNDHDFLSSEELESYEVGGTNSYYKKLGEVNGTTYYYREM